MKNMGNRDYQLWDEQDGFFYDVLRYPDGRYRKFRVRSLVGLIPLFAVERLEEKWIEPFKEFRANFALVHEEPPRDLARDVVHTVEHDGEVDARPDDPEPGPAPPACSSGSATRPSSSPTTASAASRRPTRGNPFVFDGRSVGYEPAEAIGKLKGGNSNWRGPIWFPTGFLLIESAIWR